MRREIFILVGAAVFAALPSILGNYWIGLLTQALLFGGFAMGLDLLIGYARMPTLGHAAFFGLGGYGAALAITQANITPWPAALIGLGVSLTIAILFAPLAVRTRGLTFLTITLAFGQVVWGLATRWTSFTGGENGIPGIPRPVFIWDIQSTAGFYYLTLLVVILVSLGISVLAGSAVGMSFLGVQNSDVRMSALGYNVQRRRVLAFVIASFVGAIYGVLNLYFNKFIGPGSLSWQLSAQMLLAVVIGGSGSLWGPFLAGTGLHVLENTLIGSTQRWPMVLGGLYVVSVTLLPDGISSLALKLRRFLPQRTEVQKRKGKAL